MLRYNGSSLREGILRVVNVDKRLDLMDEINIYDYYLTCVMGIYPHCSLVTCFMLGSGYVGR